MHRFVDRYGMRLGARRFVAGETAEEFLRAARTANDGGFAVAGGILGEAVTNPAEAGDAASQYCALLQAFAERRIDANVAFKPTHVGLGVDPELAFENALAIAKTALATGNTVRLDMEQSSVVDATLALYRRLRSRFDNVGFALQSYLFRSASDLDAILRVRPNVRIVKGAYLEAASVAYQKKSDVDANYLRLAEVALSGEGYTAIATHDAALIAWVESFAARKGLPKRDRFEFQMLYGIATPLAQRLIDRGYRIRLAIPFGRNWFPYLMRRLAERPANLAFFLKGAFARG
ncbi:MAG: proline dehydrogenase family protein [Candidatus Tumulicola sp.]